MKILVIGESCLDVYKYVQCLRNAPECPVPVLTPLYTTESPGMAQNVALNFETLGAHADIITNENWRDIRKIRLIDDNTGHMFCRVDENDKGYTSISEQLYYHPKYEYDAFVISDYNKGLITIQDIENLMHFNKPVFLDSKRLLTNELCDAVSFIKINENELQKSVHNIDFKKYQDKFIITKGRQGAEYMGYTFDVPDVPMKNPSGAGDAFLSGLVVKYLKTQDIMKAIDFANEVATQKVQKRGTSL